MAKVEALRERIDTLAVAPQAGHGWRGASEVSWITEPLKYTENYSV
jgi:hypothetical protein